MCTSGAANESEPNEKGLRDLTNIEAGMKRYP